MSDDEPRGEASVDLSSTESCDSFFSCRRCGKRLFDGEVVTHGNASFERKTDAREPISSLPDTSDGDASRASRPALDRKKWKRENWVNASAAAGTGCTSVFLLHPPDWTSCGGSNEGRIICPKCESKIGTYVWSGASCSCGQWVTPSFQFQLARIDKMRTRNILPSPSSHHGTITINPT